MKLTSVHSDTKEAMFFSLASLLNTYSMSLILIFYGIVGNPNIAADIGIVQAATFAFFYAFSANARGLVLSEGGSASASLLMRVRVILLVPLAVASWLLVVPFGHVNQLLATLLILRRVSEWFGEIGLAIHERKREVAYAKQTITCEVASIAACLAIMLRSETDFITLIPTVLWALTPLLALRHISPIRSEKGKYSLKSFAPHLGSSVIVGVGVYIFRVSLLMLAGKATAGALFTAFAIGGIAPTILGQGLAPALASRYKTSVWLRKMLAIPVLLFSIGCLLVLLLNIDFFDLDMIAGQKYFYMAIGWSIAGGGIMIIANAFKARLIQRHESRDVFGADLMANLLIMTSVPFVYYFFGVRWLVGLYFLSACINFIFLFFSGSGRGGFGNRHLFAMSTLGFCIVMPIFFRIDGTLFFESETILNSGQNLAALPLPISIGMMFLGIAIFGNYSVAIRSIYVLFVFSIILTFSALFVAQTNEAALGPKILALGQYVLPMFGLVLGEMYGDASTKPIFERSALLMLLMILPAQLAATWMMGYTLLQPKIFVFSIYQHLQYFPMIVTALATMVCFGLWKESRSIRCLLVVFIPFTMVYMLATLSMGGIIGLIAGITSFCAWYWIQGIAKRSLLVILGITLFSSACYLWIAQSGHLAKWIHPIEDAREEMTFETKFVNLDTTLIIPLPKSVLERRDIWAGYLSELLNPPLAFFVGHIKNPSIASYPSAHNYWLDLVYNFGFIALIPMLALISRTILLALKVGKDILRDPLVLGACIATAYLIVFEGFLKVGMKQPYPGILTFFIWGLLLVRMRHLQHNSIKKS